MSFIDKNMKFVNYLYTLTDDVGILQHSIFGVPDPKMGYTTDDNARALILAVMLYETKNDIKFLKLITKYLSFMLNAQNDDGKFKNFMNYERIFTEVEGSEDCFGRCLWALGRTISSPCVPENIKRSCNYMISKSLKNISNLTFPKSKAYSLVGLTYLEATEEVKHHITHIATSLTDQYMDCIDNNWHWFEDIMSYSNSIIPWSLLRAFEVVKKNIFIKTAIESIEFLEHITLKDKFFKPIGCNGWYYKGYAQPAEYDEQPIEACETVLMYIDYFKTSKNMQCLDNAFKCFCWFRGQNSGGLSLIDNETGACYDGITKTGQNYNQGSESIISYGIALIEMSRIYSKDNFSE